MTNIRITGIADVNRVLQEIAPREAINLLRTTTLDLAKGISKDAKAKAPRDKGDVSAGIKHKRALGDKNTVKSEVLANTNDTSFYWRFLEYGQGPDGVEHAFFLGALMQAQAEMEQRYLKSFTTKLTGRLARLAKKSKG